jgi:hypothetical protein
VNVRTTGKSGLVCWTNHAAYDSAGYRWQPPVPSSERRLADVEAGSMRRTGVRWFVALWVWLFGLRESMHAVFACEAPVRPGEMRKRPGVLWPRVVTMRFIAGGEDGGAVPSWGAIRVLYSPRLVAWRERRATLAEVIRHHGAALYEQHGRKLSLRWFVRGQR